MFLGDMKDCLSKTNAACHYLGTIININRLLLLEVKRLSKRNAVRRQKILLISSLPTHLLSRGGVTPDVIHNSRALANFPHAFNALTELAKQGY